MAVAEEFERGPLVSTRWLLENISAPDIRVIDASWHLPNSSRNAAAEFMERRIPGTVFFDIDEVSDDRSPLPHMLPPVEKFMSRIRKIGVGDGHRVVIYDTLGLFSAPRVWWTFKVFGHPQVRVLDGGLPAWIKNGGAVEAGEPQIKHRHFTPDINGDLVKDVTQVAQVVKLGGAQIVDARSPARFEGAEPEPRKGLKSGRIPGSFNVPFTSLLNEDGTLRDGMSLRKAFEKGGVDLSRPIITSCGSGVTAAVLCLALDAIGHREYALYDGSWAEWGAGDMLNVEVA